MKAPESSGEPSLKPGAALQPEAIKKPAGTWVRIALAASLAVNLAVAGIVAGAMLRDGGGMHGRILATDLSFGPFTEALSKEDRAKLRGAFLKAAPEMRDTRRAIRADVVDLLAQLRAVPFDADALRATFDRQNTRNTDRLKLGQSLIFDLLVGMNDDARQAFANRLEESLSKGPKRRNGPAEP